MLREPPLSIRQVLDRRRRERAARQRPNAPNTSIAPCQPLDNVIEKDNTAGGDCLYRALAYCLLEDEEYHAELREQACSWIEGSHHSLNAPEVRQARTAAIESLSFALFGHEEGGLPILHEAGESVRKTRTKYNIENGIPENTEITLNNAEEIARRYAFQQRQEGIWGNTIDITAIAWAFYLKVCVYRNKHLEGFQFGPLDGGPANILCKDNLHFVALVPM